MDSKKKRKVMCADLNSDSDSDSQVILKKPKRAPHVPKNEPKVKKLIKEVSNGINGRSDANILSNFTCVPEPIVQNVIKLLDQECTVPFISRYRKEMTNNLPAEKIREIQTSYENIKSVHKKVENILKSVDKSVIDEKAITELQNATTMEEVDLLYAPFKPGAKRSLAERAKKLGLQPISVDLLEGRTNLVQTDLHSYVNPDEPGLATIKEVKAGIHNIIANCIAKDSDILDVIRDHPSKKFIDILAAQSASAKKEEKQAFVEGKTTQQFKFENYFAFKRCVKDISAHEVMALNRGENLKVLSVKAAIPNNFKRHIIEKCNSKFLKASDSSTVEFIEGCIEDAYNRLIEPLIIRQTRSELFKNATKESVSVFCSNLQRLLLTPPVNGEVVIGIDPGFSHGCKIAVVSETGNVLDTDVIYPHRTQKMKSRDVSEEKLMHFVFTHKATTFAIGNGTACRETEMWLSNLIKQGNFAPHDVKYCIVNECASSIYSVSKEAELELPDLDPNVRSAVSIARRLQDPLLEYVKIDPKHLGVGMYQHDIPDSMLKIALDSVVVECVSFVGVDLNTCPESVLKKVSGLSSAKAKKIIEWREANGGFVNRQQLHNVKGLGPKTFEQCAGFVKILPETSNSEKSVTAGSVAKNKKGQGKNTSLPNPLDTTVIHPESYHIAERFLAEVKSNVEEIGQPSLLLKVTKYFESSSIEIAAEQFSVTSHQLKLIVDAFQRPKEYDIRAEFEKPLFQTGVMSMSDIKVGQELTGRVNNVTNFGAFVDIGVGRSGLIHTSKMRGKSLQLGDRVSVKVLTLDIQKQRIGLSLFA